MGLRFECDVSKNYGEFVRRRVEAYAVERIDEYKDKSKKELQKIRDGKINEYQKQKRELERKKQKLKDKDLKYTIIFIILFITIFFLALIIHLVFLLGLPIIIFYAISGGMRVGKLIMSIEQRLVVLRHALEDDKYRINSEMMFLEYLEKSNYYKHVVSCPICKSKNWLEKTDTIPFQDYCGSCKYIFTVIADTKRERYITYGPRGGKKSNYIEYDGIKAIKPKTQKVEYIDKSVNIDESVNIEIKDSIIYKSTIVGKVDKKS